MRLTVDVPENVAAMADPLALERIVDNLVDNACKYAAQGDDPQIAIAAHIDGRSAVLRVSDRGPGLDPEVRPFVAFARSAEKAAGSAPGVGLGLALCRRLARAMGGDVRYAAGSPGAVFEIRLPAR
jgi:signal transduction histidine kinase